MIDISNGIISDTIQGALALSVFDFVACFFVLYFISFFIKGISYIDNKLPSTEENDKSNEK